MRNKSTLRFISFAMLAALLLSLLTPVFMVKADSSARALSEEVSPYDLIALINAWRVSQGYGELIEDATIDAVAQATAQEMADTNATWHLGGAPERIQAAGYGGGAKVWATENFAMGGYQTIDRIAVIWSDAAHMLPATNPAYCNVGAGIATAADGTKYYVLQAAYAEGKSCGTYSSGGAISPVTGSTVDKNTGVSMIVPVKVADADADGIRHHEVQYGQSLWLIAVAYGVKIDEIREWNNLPESYKIQPKDILAILGPGAKGYNTPTPVGLIIKAAPDAEGNVTHIVEAYQTLEKIGAAYGVSVDRILRLNHWQVDWPLQVGQKLIVVGKEETPTPTPRPLTPLEKLTLAPDGKYYHRVREGENFTRIAELYGITEADLLAWNPQYQTESLWAGEFLLLHVTPPATATFTPEPTLTPTPTVTPTPVPTSTATPVATTKVAITADSSTSTQSPSATPAAEKPWYVVGGVNFLWFLPITCAMLLIIEFSSKRRISNQKAGDAKGKNNNT